VTSSDQPRVGRLPTARTDNLRSAAEDLAPHHSLNRIESTAKFLLGTVGLVGGLVTGFGIFEGSLGADRAGWLLPCLVCAALAVILSVLAAMGGADEVNVDDLEDVDRYFSRQIERRGWLVRLAGIALAASLVLALLPAAMSGHKDDHERDGFPAFVSGLVLGDLLDCDLLSGPADARCEVWRPHRSGHGDP
jgi:hypothetical protein